MGYDKADVGWVVHFQMPASPIAYQQVGRAGRALTESYGVLLAGNEDGQIQDWFMKRSFPGRRTRLTHVDPDGTGSNRRWPSRGYRPAARANLSGKRAESLMVQLDVEKVLSKGSRAAGTAPLRHGHTHTSESKP